MCCWRNKLKSKKKYKIFKWDKKLVGKISNFREETDKSQKIISKHLTGVDEIIKIYSNKIFELYETSLQVTEEVSNSSSNLSKLTDEIDNISEKITFQSNLVNDHSVFQEEMYRSVLTLIPDVKNAYQINISLNDAAEKGKENIKDTVNSIKKLEKYQEQMLAVIKILKDYNTKSILIMENITKIRNENDVITNHNRELLTKYNKWNNSFIVKDHLQGRWLLPEHSEKIKDIVFRKITYKNSYRK